MDAGTQCITDGAIYDGGTTANGGSASTGANTISPAGAQAPGTDCTVEAKDITAEGP